MNEFTIEYLRGMAALACQIHTRWQFTLRPKCLHSYIFFRGLPWFPFIVLILDALVCRSAALHPLLSFSSRGTEYRNMQANDPNCAKPAEPSFQFLGHMLARSHSFSSLLSETIRLRGGSSTEWISHTDPSSGATYYYNSATQETSWTLPQGARLHTHNQESVATGSPLHAAQSIVPGPFCELPAETRRINEYAANAQSPSHENVLSAATLEGTIHQVELFIPRSVMASLFFCRKWLCTSHLIFLA